MPSIPSANAFETAYILEIINIISIFYYFIELYLKAPPPLATKLTD
jgi:hypothetical protein